MSKKEIRIECLSEAMSDAGVKATNEQIIEIEEAFSTHIEMESEMDSYQHRGFKEECAECSRLKSKVRELESELEIYKNSVKSRRNATRVWTENGDVHYA